MNVSTLVTSCGAVLMVSFAGAGLWATSVVPVSAEEVRQTNLVSDGFVPAKFVDKQLLNPWGISEGPTTPFWVSDNNAGVATIYSVPPSNSSVSPLGLFVNVPPATGAAMSNPTGQVFNSVGGFDLSNGKPATFLFDSEDGAISGWNSALGFGPAVPGLIAVDNGNPDPSKNAVYKGLAISNFDGGTLYATNFRADMVEMYNSSFKEVGSFTDPTLPAGYAPFDVKVINGELYVTFALQDAAKHDDVAGLGNGFVDMFDLSGGHMKRLISGRELDSPWGLQIAPKSLGSLAGDLLVGNFGNGWINAFDPNTGAFEGTLDGTNGSPLVIDGLWSLTVGNGTAVGGSLNALYFSAGPNGENDGLFGSLTAVPETSTWAMLLLGFGGLGVALRRRRRSPVAMA